MSAVDICQLQKIKICNLHYIVSICDHTTVLIIAYVSCKVLALKQFAIRTCIRCSCLMLTGHC